jgi:hypothetical protein
MWLGVIRFLGIRPPKLRRFMTWDIALERDRSCLTKIHRYAKAEMAAAV